jgi:hypothetical protein
MQPSKHIRNAKTIYLAASISKVDAAAEIPYQLWRRLAIPTVLGLGKDSNISPTSIPGARKKQTT